MCLIVLDTHTLKQGGGGWLEQEPRLWGKEVTVEYSIRLGEKLENVNQIYTPWAWTVVWREFLREYCYLTMNTAKEAEEGNS